MNARIGTVQNQPLIGFAPIAVKGYFPDIAVAKVPGAAKAAHGQLAECAPSGHTVELSRDDGSMNHRRNLRIAWINPERVDRTSADATATRASVRLRCIEPARDLPRWGCDVTDVCLFDYADWASDPAFYDRDVFVFGQLFADVTPIVERIRTAGGAIVADVCDNVFAPPEDGLRPFYERLLPEVDLVVAATPELRQVLRQRTPRSIPVEVVPDAVEGTREPPAFAPTGERLSLLWYGYPNNLPALSRMLPSLAGLARDDRVVTVTALTAWGAIGPVEPVEAIGRNCLLRRLEWSRAAAAGELAQCDAVVIPSDGGPAQWTKSPNRLVRALWSGRLVAATPLPGYREFAPYVALGDDIAASIDVALASPEVAVERIRRGQEYIATHYSHQRTAARWAEVLAAAAARRPGGRAAGP